MTINHHASDEMLLAFAAGQLSSAPALILASHLAMSGQDADRLCVFEQLGGALLDEQPLDSLAPDLFDRVLAHLDAPVPEEKRTVVRDHAALDMGVPIPAPLAQRRIGKWRTLAPGVRFADVDVSEDSNYKVVLLRVGPGKALPQHGHSGSEFTVILKGRFRDENGVYGPGDFEEEDGNSNHRPVVEPEGECICLTAIEGRLIPKNWLARVMLPLFGF